MGMTVGCGRRSRSVGATGVREGLLERGDYGNAGGTGVRGVRECGREYEGTGVWERGWTAGQGSPSDLADTRKNSLHRYTILPRSSSHSPRNCSSRQWRRSTHLDSSHHKPIDGGLPNRLCLCRVPPVRPCHHHQQDLEDTGATRSVAGRAHQVQLSVVRTHG